MISELTAISPLDGRYRNKVGKLADYFSEYALIRYRVWVEVEYLIALHAAGLPQMPPLSDETLRGLRAIYQNFEDADAQKVKEIEKITNHDVKAVEYFLKEKIQVLGDPVLLRNLEFIHFGLTSQDINNTSTPMMIRDGLAEVYIPQLKQIINRLTEYADRWLRLPMLARTHGQPASPTTLGKELAVFAERLQLHTKELQTLPYPAKFGGATGNLNAHYIAYPEVDWVAFANRFVQDTLGLTRSQTTTQIEHYDGLGRLFDCLKRINSILTDLCQDIWLYISLEYFKQKTKKGEIGSSAMPHKVNPIDFENAEGNCGISTALLEYMSRKLPVSRMQRDLTDSTILRNVGTAVGHAYLALLSVQRGLNNLLVNEARLHSDLQDNWAVLAEAIQTILRREGYPAPYEALKSLTRGKEGITEESLHAFVNTLEVSESVRKELLVLRPEGYIGNAGDPER